MARVSRVGPGGGTPVFGSSIASRTLPVHGAEIPRIGLGTWQLDDDAAEEGVRDALELGYRHIDTARLYGNEAGVGRGLATGGVPREEIFLTTKLAHDRLKPSQVRAQLEDSLRTLDTDYVDLLLIHWPSPDDVPLRRTLAVMTHLRDEGKLRNLGVSNFPSALMREALLLAPIVTNQVEYHPYLGQPALLELARATGIVLTAYSPFAHGRVLTDPVLAQIGEAHAKTAGQVALRWLLDQPNVAALPKASSHARRAENLDVFDFELTDDERARIVGLERGLRTGDPSWAPDWD